MSAISKQEIFDEAAQCVRVILRNQLGHVVHDMTLPLVVDIQDEQGRVIGFRPYDVDREINAAVKLHEDRHAQFLKAAHARGRLTNVQPSAISPSPTSPSSPTSRVIERSDAS